MLCSPIVVRHDGIQLKMDGVHENGVFCRDNFQGTFLLDLEAGLLQKVPYTPFNLVSLTPAPASVLREIIPEMEGVERKSARFPQMLGLYESRLWMLSTLELYDCVAPVDYMPIVVAFINQVDPKEIGRAHV